MSLSVAIFIVVAFGSMQRSDAWQQAATAEPQKVETQDKFDLQVNLDSYDQVWKTIKKSHWDPELVGEKWDAARPKYRKQVEQAKTIQDVRVAIEGLIGELGQSHFGIIPGDSYDAVGDKPKGDGTVGIEIRLLADNKAAVSKVTPGSSADKAGVKPGWELVQVGSKDAQTILQKLKGLKSQVTRYDTLVGLSLTNGCLGEIGKTKKLGFVAFDGTRHDLELKLEEPPGNITKFGNLPKMRIESETRTLGDGVGYFRFNMFFDPARVMSAFFKAVKDPKHQKGFIIDLRGNVGGMGGMTMGMARPFTKEKTKLGTMKTRQGELTFAVLPTPDPFPGRVAVLIDACSISSAEILSGGLQDIGAAKVFGSRTAGLALPSQIAKLPNGDGFQFAFADYVSEKGKKLEKLGVTPDFPIDVTTDMLSGEPDPVLAAAKKWVAEGSKQ